MARAPNQLGPLRRSEKYREFGGLPEIAKQLQERYASVAWPPGARTLATLLGKLDNGDVVWWRKRPEHAACLAQLLNLNLLDLGLTGLRTAAAHVMEFPKFPGMPPLDLRRDGQWQLGSEQPVLAAENSSSFHSLEEWFTPSPRQRRPPYELNWLCMADDLERHVLVKILEAAGHYELVFVQTLEEASGRLASTKPLIVVVRGLGARADADFTALALRPESVGLLVIAPDALPARPEMGAHGHVSWERISLQGRERIAFDLSASGGGWSKVQQWRWMRFPDWRARFLTWLERHFDKAGKDSLYSAAGVQAWLERFDPQTEWFHTVSDLLSLCLGFESEKKLPREHDAHAGHMLVAALQRSQPAFIGTQLAELCLARWRCRHVAWNGALSLDEWAALTPRAPVVLGEDDLNPIVQGKTAAQRKRAADALSQRLQMANPQSLLQGGQLKPVSGAYDFQHRSLVNLLVRDQLFAEMVDAPISDWAWASFDSERCCLVDAALDALPLQDLQALASCVVELEPFGVESIGASEAIFYAIGRRIAKGEISSLGDAFVALARSVVARLNMDEVASSLPAPWSRAMDSEKDQLEWISACWAWSLMPAPSLAAGASWLFPGSSDVLPEPPWWLTSLWPDKNVEQLPRCWQLFFQIAGEWVKDLDVPAPDVPRILKLAYLVKTAHGGWAAQPAWWEDLLHFDNINWINQALVKGFGTALPQEAAKRLWPSYLKWEATAKTEGGALTQHVWQVRRWLLASLPIPWAIDSLDVASRVYLASCPLTLPPPWRGALLLSLKEQWKNISWVEQSAFLQGFGPAIADELEQLLGCDLFLGGAAASLMWQWNARRAGDLLQHAETLAPEAWSKLFDACPTAQLPVAISVLQAYPERLDRADRTAWVKRKLPASGGLAQSLLALL